MYVQRNKEGRIVGVFSLLQPGLAEEWVDGARIEHPPKTEHEMVEAEIAQDKKYLADTDYIVTKIAEAMALGQETRPLLDQYAAELDERELARIRIRSNGGGA